MCSRGSDSSVAVSVLSVGLAGVTELGGVDVVCCVEGPSAKKTVSASYIPSDMVSLLRKIRTKDFP